MEILQNYQLKNLYYLMIKYQKNMHLPKKEYQVSDNSHNEKSHHLYHCFQNQINSLCISMESEKQEVSNKGHLLLYYTYKYHHVYHLPHMK